MTELLVAGLDRREDDRLARRLRRLARHVALPVVVRVTTDAVDVQRLGNLGGCTLLVDGRKVAERPFPGDAEIERRLVTSVAEHNDDTFAATA